MSEGEKSLKITAVVLTFNEKNHIKECLEHLKPHVDYIVVVDGGSTDGTLTIAKIFADKVEVRPPLEDFGEEREYAWSLAPEDTDWTLFVDIDERFHELFLPNIRMIIEGVTAQYPETISFRFPRANLPKCSDYPDYQTRLLKNNENIVWKNKVDDVPTLDGLLLAGIPGKCMTVLDKPIWHFREKRPRWYREDREKRVEVK